MNDFNTLSKRHAVSSLCKQCETEIASVGKAAAGSGLRTAEPIASQPGAARLRPFAISVAQGASGASLPKNFCTLGTLEDIPEHFPKVVEIFRRTLASFVGGIDFDLRQYRPSMVSEDNTACLRGMIEKAYTDALTVYDSFMVNTYGIEHEADE